MIERGNEYQLPADWTPESECNTLYRETMVKLGECMDHMAARGWQERESWICGQAANALYLLVLNGRRAQEAGNENAEFNLLYRSAMKTLCKVCASYADAPDDKLADGLIEGLRALVSYRRIEAQLLNQLKNVQSERESVTSKSE